MIEEEEDENQHWLLFRSEIEKVSLFIWERLQVEDYHIYIHGVCLLENGITSNVYDSIDSIIFMFF